MIKFLPIAATLVLACACREAPSRADPALPAPQQPLAMPDGGLGAFLSCMRERDATLISAHRGGPEPGYPENALETLANTVAQGPMLLEIDVRRSSDGELLLFHDDELDRDTEATGPFSVRRGDTLRALRLRDNEGELTDARIPTLSDALEWARGGAVLQLDVKRGVAMDEVVDVVQRHDAEDYVAIITYNVRDAARVAAASDHIMISASIDEIEDLTALISRGVPAERIIAWTGLTTPRPALWRSLAARDITVNFGTLFDLDPAIELSGDDSAYADFAAQGADLIATDRPHAAFAALEARQNTAEAIAACSATN